MLDSKTIETLSVNAVKNSIVTSPFLDQFISDNDKEPSWDGHVYIYKSANNRRKDNLSGRLPVQVKGKVYNSFSEAELSYQMPISDLRNYLNDGGIVLFVVLLSDNGQQNKIYYAELTPIKLRLLLDSAGKQASKAVVVKPFPDDGDAKATIFINCLQNCQKQASFVFGKLFSIDELIKMGVLEGLTIPLAGAGTSDPKSVLFNNENYLYANIKGSSALQPLELIPKCVSTEEVLTGIVSVDSKCYYTKYTLISDAKTTTFKFGDSLTIKLEKDNSSGTINYKCTSSLRKAAIDIAFFLDAIEKKEIVLNGRMLPFNIDLGKLHGFDVSAEKDKLVFIRRVIQAFEELGYRGDLDLKTLSDEDFRNLNRLITAFVDKEDVRGLKPDLPPFANMVIGNLKFILALVKDEGEKGKYKISDFFKSDFFIAFGDINSEEEKEPTSKYAILHAKELLELGNLQPELFLPSFQEFDNNSNFYRANLFMLELISAYDLSGEKRKDLLSVAEQFDAWLLNNASPSLDKSVLLLNHLQIIKRKRAFSEDEQALLWDLAESSDSTDDTKVGAFLLLGQQLPAEKHFNMLPVELQDMFKQYPIYHFWKGTEDTNNG